MIQTIISGVAVILLSWLLKIIIKRNKNLDERLKEMRNELILARVDSQTAINVLIKVSNGIPFSKYVDEERARLMQSVNFQYRD